MKLTYTTFKQGIEILSCSYLDWKFNKNDEKMLATWYSRLVHMISEDEFLSAVNYYSHVMEKGPNSPLALRMPYAEKCVCNSMTPSDALITLRQLLSLYIDDEDDSRLTESLSYEPFRAIKLTYTEMKFLVKGWHSNYTLYTKLEDSYTCTWFISQYKKNLSDVIDQYFTDKIAALPSGSNLPELEG